MKLQFFYTFILLLAFQLVPGKVYSQDSSLYRRKILTPQFDTTDKMVKVVFVDVDGTLLMTDKSVKGAVILPFVADRIADLNQAGYLVMIVSNQIQAKNEVTIKSADKSLFNVTQMIKAKNSKAQIHYIDFSDVDVRYRKPNTGMAENLENELALMGLKVNWSKSFMVGDRSGDQLFAKNLKISFYEPADFFGWRCHGVTGFSQAIQAVQYMKKHSQRCSVLKLN